MTRQFKSTITDWVAEKDKFSEMYKLFNTFGARKGSLPIKMVENSNEWEEITEPELVEGKWIVTAGNKTARICDIEGDDVMLDNVLKFSCNHIGNVTVSKSSIDRQATPKKYAKPLMQ